MKAFDVAGNSANHGRALARSERRLAALRYIRNVAAISDSEADLILQGASDVSFTTAGTELLRSGAQLGQPRVILSGWAALSIVLADGRRQLLDFVLPGDLVGFSLHADAHAKAAVVCLTPVETVKLPALASCFDAPERFSGLLTVLHTAQDNFENRLLNQIVRNGCQSAHEKLCSLLLELYARLARVGLAEQLSFELPISQIVIADALGLSTVHVNRTFQHLKREGIIQSEGHRLTILNLQALRKFAGQLRLPKTSERTPEKTSDKPSGDGHGQDRVDGVEVRLPD
jgi:CRP-like cAMP-binding protein